MKRSEAANLSKATLISEKILAENDSTIIKNGDQIFLSENLHQVKPTPNLEAKPGQQFTLGNLSSEKIKYSGIHSFPKNTDVVVEYIYENPQPVNSGSDAITDPRAVIHNFQSSINAIFRYG